MQHTALGASLQVPAWFTPMCVYSMKPLSCNIVHGAVSSSCKLKQWALCLLREVCVACSSLPEDELALCEELAMPSTEGCLLMHCLTLKIFNCLLNHPLCEPV